MYFYGKFPRFLAFIAFATLVGLASFPVTESCKQFKINSPFCNGSSALSSGIFRFFNGEK